jgi:multimeric flavodoxin WrbA
MKMIIHDLDPQEFAALGLAQPPDTVVISDNGTIHHCIGCYGCWIKTPGKCILNDDYQNMGKLLSKCDEVLVISKCCYGGYSPFISNVWNRSISYLLPYFIVRDGLTHHPSRYDNNYTLAVHFYGEDITEAEKNTAKGMAKASGACFNSAGTDVFFHKSPQEIREGLK